TTKFAASPRSTGKRSPPPSVVSADVASSLSLELASLVAVLDSASAVEAEVSGPLASVESSPVESSPQPMVEASKSVVAAKAQWIRKYIHEMHFKCRSRARRRSAFRGLREVGVSGVADAAAAGP